MEYFYSSNFMDRVGVEFYRLLRRHLQPGSTILDLGAGPGEARTDLRDVGCTHVGLDVDPRIAEHAWLDDKVQGTAERMPFASETFDLVFADFIMEHVEQPGKVLSEIWRILKPGGLFLFHTPNRYHYASIAARLTTPAFQERVLRKLETRLERALGNIHPVLYRFNSGGTISRTLRRAGFESWELRYEESEPYYLAISWPLLLVGVLYERVVNRSDSLRFLRAAIFGRCYK
jgi:ubiquinone/menaquinone biosynthesis C-methylase UbiE